MPYCLPGDETVRWRCLDSLAWALAALACTVYLPQVGRTCLGDLSLLYMVPVLWAGLAVLSLGAPAGLTDPWQLWRLRSAWISLAGLAPFVSWWLRCTDVPYLAAAAAIAMAVGAWALLETSVFVSQIGRSRGLATLVLDALGVRIGLVYLLVIPIASLSVTFVVALLVHWAAVPGDWLRFWRQVPPWLRIVLHYAPLLALANLARLLLRASASLSVLPRAKPSPTGDAHDAPTPSA